MRSTRIIGPYHPRGKAIFIQMHMRNGYFAPPARREELRRGDAPPPLR
jgi:hypothetical protein